MSELRISNSTLEIAKKQIELNIYTDRTDYGKDIDETVVEIGRRFAKARIEKGYSLRQVEAIAGKHIRRTLSELEVGVPVNAQIKNVLLLAKVLGVPYEDIVYGEDKNKEKLVEAVKKLPIIDKKRIIMDLIMDVFEEEQEE